MTASREGCFSHVDPKSVKLILASASPRRAALLAEAGYTFEVRPPCLHEDDVTVQNNPAVLAMALAYAKARRIADELDNGVVLGADTIVCLGHEIIGKPATPDEARTILSRLSGTTHSVITGVCLVDAVRSERLMGFEETLLRMKKLSPKELEDYVNSGEGIGKAGAYAIQETGDRYVEIIHGSLSNVIGLPMELLARLLDRMLKLIRH